MEKLLSRWFTVYQLIIKSADLSFYIGDANEYVSTSERCIDAISALLDYGFGTLGLNKVWMELYENDDRKLKLFKDSFNFSIDGVFRDNWFTMAITTSFTNFTRRIQWLDYVIPARGGSKRIPRKNIKPFLGKPIIAYSIEIALRSGLFDTIMVSTDDVEIAECARKYGADVPFLRSKTNSNDYATTQSVLEEVLREYSKKGMYWSSLFVFTPRLRWLS